MKRILSVGACVAALSACSNVAKVSEEISAKLPPSQKAMEAPIQIQERPRVVERRGAFLPVSEVVYQKDSGAWLRAKTLSLTARDPISLTQVIAQFAAKGVNIASELPLDSITYVGTINSTDAESALKQVLGSVGLDYQADDARKLVVIKPLASRTWYLNLGNRRTSYSSNETAGGLGGSNSTPANGGSQTVGATGSQGLVGQSVGGQQTGTSSTTQTNTQQMGTGNGSGTTVTAAEDFWGALDKELAKRLSVLVPNATGVVRGGPMALSGPSHGQIVPAIGGPIAPMGQPGMPPQGMEVGGDMYSLKKIGSHSLNPETGAITVQAPHWILSELDTYFRRTQEMFDTYLSFEGQLLLVTRSRNDSEGLDIQQFARFASGRYGAVLSNNNLGGVTVSFANGLIPSVTAGAQQVGGALLGVVSPADGLQIFNAYLSELGNVSVIQRPRVATTSGVPGEFSNITPRYYNTVSQTAAAGNTGSATQATSNTIVSKDFGTELLIYPRFDIATGLIRAKIKIRNIIPAGEQQIPQVVSVGSSAQTIIARIPLERKLNYSGEALLRDGDLIIVGGQSEESLQSDENGLPTDGSPIGGIFGVKKSSKSSGTYYFALKVSVKKR